MSDSFAVSDIPRYARVPFEILIEVARGPKGAERLLEYQDAALEMHDRIADAIGEPAAGYWIGSEPELGHPLDGLSEHNPLAQFISLNVRSVLTPVLEASREVRWTVISFRPDGEVDAYESSESGTRARGMAEFRLPTPTYGRIWATEVGRRAMAEIREEHRLGWAIFQQEVGPPLRNTIAAAKRRLRDHRRDQ